MYICPFTNSEFTIFRFNDPAEAAEMRKSEKTLNLARLSLLSWSTPDLANSMENLQP